LKSIPMLVNGDDILFWCPDMAAYGRWKDLVTVAGLKPSLGKNYCSDEYLIINSEVARIRKNVDFWGQEVWQLIGKLPSVNLGLLFGTTKSESSHALEKTIYGSHEMQRDSLRQRATDFVDGYPEDRDLMLSVFVNYWNSTLKAVPKEVSWWVHPRYGGLGLPVTREVEITERQRKLAAHLHVSQGAEHGPTIKGLAQPLPEFTEACMKAWSSVLKKVGYKTVSGGKFSAEPWRFLKYYLNLGFDPTDPAGYSAWLKSFQKLWKDSKKSWSKPLSFRKCVAGPATEFGGQFQLLVG